MRFIKYIPDTEMARYILSKPLLNHLAMIIAVRAKREDCIYSNLKAGQCWLGDYKEIGLTRSEYRRVIDELQKIGFATFKPTNKGTTATLVSVDVWDLNIDDNDQQNSQQNKGINERPANRQPADHQTTNQSTNKTHTSNAVTVGTSDFFFDGNDQQNDQQNANKHTEKQPQTKNKRIKEKKEYIVKPNDLTKSVKHYQDFLEIIEFYKKLTGRSLTIPTTSEGIKSYSHYKTISARLNKKSSIENIKAVIEYKFNEWKCNDKMKKHNRLDTWLGGKFDLYFEEYENDTPTTPANEKASTLTLSEYLNQEYKQGSVKHRGLVRKYGGMEKLQSQYDLNLFRLENIAKTYKNKTITAPLIFDVMYMSLGRKFSNNPERRLKSLQTWLKSLNDYRVSQSNIREELSRYNENMDL